MRGVGDRPSVSTCGSPLVCGHKNKGVNVDVCLRAVSAVWHRGSCTLGCVCARVWLYIQMSIIHDFERGANSHISVAQMTLGGFTGLDSLSRSEEKCTRLHAKRIFHGNSQGESDEQERWTITHAMEHLERFLLTAITASWVVTFSFSVAERWWCPVEVRACGA